ITTLVHSEAPIYLSYDPATQKENMTTLLPLKNRLSWTVLRRFLTKQISPPGEVRNNVEIYSMDTPEAGTSETLIALAPDTLLYSNNAEMLGRSLEYRKEPKRAGQPAE